MANQKISDLTPVESLTDSDIFPVVQTKDYQSVTKSTTLGQLKNSVLSGASIRYPNGNIALSTANNELDFNDSDENQVVSITPSLLNVTHPRTNLSLGTTYVDPKTNYTYNSIQLLEDKGFWFKREATDANGNAVGAWQLRMSSDDSYFYGGKDIEIRAGALTLNPESQVEDLAKADLHLFSGGKLIGASKSVLSMESYTRVDIDSAYLTSTAAPTTVGTVTTQVKTYTKSWLAFDKNGATIAYGPASVSTATDSSKPSSAPMVTVTPSPICSINLSSSGTVLTSPAVTINTDNFQVKSKNGASVLFNTGTITGLVTTVAGKENATLYINRAWHNEYKISYTGTNASRPSVPIMLRVVVEKYNAQGTTLSLANFDGKISFWISEIRKSDNTAYTDAELKTIPAYLIWTNSSGVESSTPIYYKVSNDGGAIATAYDLNGKQTEVIFGADAAYRVLITNGTPRENNVLHTVGDETAAGVKTFTSGIKTNTIQDAAGNNLISVDTANNKLTLSRGLYHEMLTQDKSYTYLNDSDGTYLLSAYFDSTDTANNYIGITRGDGSNLLIQNKTSTTLYDSNSTAILSHTVGAGVTYSADSVNYFKLYNNVIAVSQPVASTSTISATGLAATVQTLTDAASIAWNAATGSNAIITLTAAGRTLANPTNIVAGTVYRLTVNQDATGSRTITTWGSNFKFPGGVKPTLTATASACDILEFYADTTTTLRLIKFVADSK